MADSPGSAAGVGAASTPQPEPTTAADPELRQREPLEKDWWALVESLFLAAVLIVASVAVVGLGLAYFSVYSLAAALGGGLVIGGALSFLLDWKSRVPTERRRPLAPLVAAILLALVLSTFWGRGPSQHVLVNRDPGAYVNTAVFIANDGGLEADYTDTPFDGAKLSYEPSVYEMESGRFEIQFNHLLPALGATAYAVGGHQVLFRLPAILTVMGLFALFLLTRRVTGRNWIPLLVPAVLGASMPVMFVARDMYSESITLLMLWSAVLALVVAAPRRRIGGAVVAGWLMGVMLAARIDGLIYAALLIPVGLIWFGVGRGSDRRERFKFLLAGGFASVVPAALGYADLQFLSGEYVTHLEPQYRPLRLALAAAVLGGLIAALLLSRESIRRYLSRFRKQAAVLASALTFLVLGGLWFVSPVVRTTGSDQFRNAVGALQAREGVPMDSMAAGWEDAMQWTEWYFGGAFLTIAVLVLTVVAYRVVMSKARMSEIIVGLFAGVVGALYWWSPSITPDHLWATRRYVPSVYPAVAIMVALGVAWLLRVLVGSGVPYRRTLALALGVILVGSTALVTWPVRWGRDQFAYQGAVESVCELVGDSPIVTTSQVSAFALRSWCDVPAVPIVQPSEAVLSELGHEWAELGEDLYVVTTNELELDEIEAVVGPKQEGVLADATLTVEKSLTRAPVGYDGRRRPLQYWVAQVESGTPED